MKISNLSTKDKNAIFHLIQILNDHDQFDYSLTDEWFAVVLNECKDHIFVAYVDNQLIGLATCMIDAAGRQSAQINVMIHPQYRRRGYGKSLFDVLIAHAHRQGVIRVEAFVKERFPYIVKFLMDRGFTTVLQSWKMEKIIGESATININGGFLGKCEFRKAREEDDRYYLAMMKSCFELNVEQDNFHQMLKDSSIEVFLLFAHQELCGMISLQSRDNLQMGYIFDVAVAPEHRGKGIGSHLISRVLDHMKRNCLMKATLIVDGTNENALSLYKRLGFEITDVDVLLEKYIRI
ncbi:hypothetical protein BHU72_00345 [Desulfuribacillus stibiiarsenatis]|uniref:N-acetyltransferase domain-containing protein n=1 Tax=Desulfuribacillus stibiiarsenatis TaxID=1390249 RepID=A0A1E5L9S1_9FIRM|nr:GNAT family N-acetyltransferase [Desulfuribacillus stibiiarsenatis]OEH86759.1 hypothetical protein BHU72_00345 [Desulfuribacillus stibiiarsenatis]